ncbi:MAG TPA: alpha/beta fold hydrolase [Pyrinomonadaceae bacterium]|nr:alpha/beta fold hydrolase [Pyrinomonadaceae bacterium]
MKPLFSLLTLLLAGFVIADAQPRIPKSSVYGPVIEGYFPGADGVRLFYRRVGSGTNRVVFLHGGPGLGIGDGGYDMEPLAPDRVLYMYDQRGTGRSEVVTDPKLLTAEYHVRDLEAFRKLFGIERMTLIGLSWGSGLAALYAAAHPTRVERLLLVSPMPPAKLPFLEQRFARINSLIGPANVSRLAEIRERLPKASDGEAVTLCREAFTISSQPYLVNPAGFTRERSEEMCDAPPAALRNRFVVVTAVLDSLGDWDFRPILSAIRVPTLVIEGEKTNVPIDATRVWATSIPNARLQLISKAGHLHFIEQPADFFKAAERFLTSK